jgi:hypothetical protein
MPNSDKEELDVERLLELLDSKKTTLDVVIAGLEREARMEDRSLATAIQLLLRDFHGPLTDLPSESQSLLLHLATQQRRGARGSREKQRKSSRRVA